MSEDIEKKDTQTQEKKKQGLNARILMGVLLLMLLMATVIVAISAFSVRTIYYNQYSKKAQDLVRILADQIDGDWVKEFGETYERDEYYEDIKEYMDNIKNDFSDLQYLYIFKPEDTYFTYLIEAQAANDDPDLIASPGMTFEYRQSEYDHLLPDVQNKRASTGLILGQDAGYGKPISAWAPILDSDGNVAAMVEADYIIKNIGEQITRSIAGIIAVQVISILTVAVLMILTIRKNVINPLTYLEKQVESYESGELSLDLKRFPHEDELHSLGVSFEDMTQRITRYIEELTSVTAEKERIGAELNVATQIQSDMLPRLFPAFPDRKEFDLYATMDPAKEVGGDFYDFFMIDEDHLGLVIADVSGKGVPAALFMVIAKTLIKNRALTGGYTGPAQVLENVNDQLCEGNDADLFVTVWFGILEISSGLITFASAGHEYPAICREGKGFELEKNKPSLPLATFEGIKMQNNEIKMKPGEVLYLYTDGITEATNVDKDLFGEKRMLSSLSTHSDEDAQQLLKSIRRDIDMFVGAAPQFDDMTMLALRYLGPV
ncbi:MAG: SpoIIE family protein phosphatase [Lachnospiraceae bacterium]|nr:SpoIIE family protein phosphatase [Lachnospiraceae bacterium]